MSADEAMTMSLSPLPNRPEPGTAEAARALLRIAYIGPESGTSLHRARALERLGHTVTIIDPWSWLGRSKWVARWLHHAGGIGVGLRIDRLLFKAAVEACPDLVFVNQGEFLGPSLLRRLRTLDVPIVNYINDNPFSGRDGFRFHYFLNPWSPKSKPFL